MKAEDISFKHKWESTLDKLGEVLGKRPENLNVVLFYIGIQELGVIKPVFSKEEKQDLMHIAVCKLLSKLGYYELEHLDAEGWPHWKLVKALPAFKLNEQEKLLQMQVIDYVETELGI